MKGISAAIIAHNEADRIGKCLAALGFCDEIVVVDSGSTDGTQDIARNAGARVVHRDWTGYRDQKMYAVSLCRGPWVLLLDADETVDDELARNIEFISDDTPMQGFIIRRYLFFMGRRMRHGSRPERLTRLFLKDRALFLGGDTHPRVEVHGPVGKVDGSLMHESYRNLEDYFNRFNRYTTLAATERFDGGRKFSFIQNFRVFYEFMVRYFFRLGFLDGYPGFVYAMISSFYAWIKYAKLKELEDGHEKK